MPILLFIGIFTGDNRLRIQQELQKFCVQKYRFLAFIHLNVDHINTYIDRLYGNKFLTLML